jgi:hypothetical protein
MKRMVWLLGLATVLGPIGVGTARGGETDPNAKVTPQVPAFAVCRANVKVSGSARQGVGGPIGGPLKLVVYLSDVMPRGPVNDADITWAFEAFVKQKYGLMFAATECRAAWTREEALQLRDGEFREGPGEKTFVETGWQYPG